MKPLLSFLSLREKIGQTLCFNQYLLKDIEDVGDYFSKNPAGSMYVRGVKAIDFQKHSCVVSEDPQENFYELIDKINASMKIPMIAAGDAEKGINTFPGHPKITSATGIGATKSPELAYELFNTLGKDLKSTGIGWLWSPVVDNPSPFCAVSLTRAYCADLELFKKLAVAEIKGLQDAGIPATLKHFPGSDKDEYRDSHFAPQNINQSFDEWFERQGCLFQAGIDAGVDAVMISHGAFSAVDGHIEAGSYIPATLSYKIITELLKEKMGFKGVVITDAVEMKGLTAVYPREKLYVELLRAGNDMLLAPELLDYVDIVERAVLSGDLPESRIDDACERILAMKEHYGFLKEDYALRHHTREERKSLVDAMTAVNKKIAPKSITLVADRNYALPIKDVKKVKIIYFGYDESSYANLDAMIDRFSEYGAKADKQKLVRDDIKTIAEEYDLIVYASYIGPHSPHGGPAFYRQECISLLYAMTEGREKSVGIGIGSPYTYFDYFSSVPVYVNAYTSNPETLEAFVDVLYGKVIPEGTSPYPLNPITGTNRV
ncbi:MAG: hypothetical protein GX633_06760 [Clostridiales bacterium]|nr:hypothetical protein [Clostridiales bacterium]